MTPDKRLIKSYVWHGKKCFFVSTIDRDSSATQGPGRFAETMVWEFDWETQKRGGLLYTDGGSQGRINHHLMLCERRFEIGTCEVPDKEKA